MVAQHLQKPLTSIPTRSAPPESYGHNMNQRLQSFLDSFGFEYEFVSATECYRAGRFNEVLRRVLERHERSARRCCRRSAPNAGDLQPDPADLPRDGARAPGGDPQDRSGGRHGDLRNAAGRLVEQSILDGQGKLQWRADWAMRWTALGVDYEMSART